MKKLLLLTVLLAGCATQPVVPLTVRVPVSVPCVAAPLPVRPDSHVQFGAGKLARPYPGYKAAVNAAEADWSAWETYADNLEAAYAGCKILQSEKVK